MIELVPMTEDEFQTYLDYAARAYGETMVRSGDWQAAQAPELAQKTLRDLLPSGLSTPGQHLLAVHDPSLPAPADAEPIGFLWIGITDRGDGPCAYIYDFVILEPFRRRGYGKAALRAVEDWVRSGGAHMITAHVTSENTIARALYDDIGYTVDQATLTKLVD
jgi:ribosomal protein S18 acetylase RimI-like enzyme